MITHVRCCLTSEKLERTRAELLSCKAGTAHHRAIEMRDGKYGWEVDVLAFGKALAKLRGCLINKPLELAAGWLECCSEACTRKNRYERPLVEEVFKALNFIAADPSGMREADARALFPTDAKANNEVDESATATHWRQTARGTGAEGLLLPNSKQMVLPLRLLAPSAAPI
jgi:hypothetical protein